MMRGLWLIAVAALVAGSQAEDSGYIIGGNEAQVGEHPYICSVQYFGGHWCGCSIISERWVITAAHCIYNNNRPRIIVGMHDQGLRMGQPAAHNSVRFIMHPQYNIGPGAFPNDLALVELSSEVAFSDYVKPIQMADPMANYQSWNGIIAGWGLTQPWNNDNNEQYLQEANVNIYDDNYCRSFWYTSYQADKMVCIGVQNQKASCNGDSGGPLVVNVNHAGQEKRILVGVTSWGIVGCTTSYPAVYVKVSHYRDWIYQQTGVL